MIAALIFSELNAKHASCAVLERTSIHYMDLDFSIVMQLCSAEDKSVKQVQIQYFISFSFFTINILTALHSLLLKKFKMFGRNFVIVMNIVTSIAKNKSYLILYTYKCKCSKYIIYMAIQYPLYIQMPHVLF